MFWKIHEREVDPKMSLDFMFKSLLRTLYFNSIWVKIAFVLLNLLTHSNLCRLKMHKLEIQCRFLLNKTLRRRVNYIKDEISSCVEVYWEFFEQNKLSMKRMLTEITLTLCFKKKQLTFLGYILRKGGWENILLAGYIADSRCSESRRANDLICL